MRSIIFIGHFRKDKNYGGTLMDLVLEDEEIQCSEETEERYISNEEYRRRLRDLFRGINENYKLRFWWKYISAIEKGED